MHECKVLFPFRHLLQYANVAQPALVCVCVHMCAQVIYVIDYIMVDVNRLNPLDRIILYRKIEPHIVQCSKVG